jgi:competence protein ComEA
MRKFTQYVGALLLGTALTAAWAEPVDLNTADAKTIADVMVGVGLSKAEAIVEYRKAHGPFHYVDDLALVKGIGAATITKNRDKLTVVMPEK